MTYAEFIARKMSLPNAVGITVKPEDIHPSLFPFQRDLVALALRRGRSAMFTDTGTGKTRMQVEWAAHVADIGRVLILAPLAVAEQTVREAAKVDVEIRYLREDDGAGDIVITNYEMMGHFDPAAFAGVVLDESSILKSYDGTTRTAIIDAFKSTPYRLACTATPAPNDHTELGNHAEFLGAKTRAEMLSEYFVHDGGSTADWRLKGHAVAAFWRWVGGWASVMRKPSDLGYDDDGFVLPDLREHRHVLALDHRSARDAGLLFVPTATTLNEQRALRRATIERRVALVAELAAGDVPALVWCELNDEADACEKSIPGAVQVAGKDSLDVKVDRLIGFAEGRYRCLVTKPSVAGFGMNWQHCSRVIFAGLSHSFEGTYQAIRRCWRYGQRSPVDVHFVATEADAAIAENYSRKAAEHEGMFTSMVGMVGSALAARWNPYNPGQKMEVPAWL